MRGHLNTFEPVMRGHLNTVKPVMRGHLNTVKPVMRGHLNIVKPVMRVAPGGDEIARVDDFDMPEHHSHGP